ncbi:GAF domain-containing protein [Dactylosporangium sp. McL0621]|uniref:GAF domain-containing protein n=1 Tax=Dactylosporangium sp. McL0621 TaxID=3415678 RepID=UPI003CEAB330
MEFKRTARLPSIGPRGTLVPSNTLRPAPPAAQARLLRTGRPELLHVALDDTAAEGLSALVPDEGMRGQVSALRPADVLGVPLTARGTTFGTLTLARRAGIGVDADDVELAEELAIRIALAVNAAGRRRAGSRAALALGGAADGRLAPGARGERLADGAALRARRPGGHGGGTVSEPLPEASRHLSALP